MPTPFPGMDPYLELPAHWSDFHSTFINYWREAVADLLPDNYEASIGERVYLAESDPEIRKLILPDVALEENPAVRRTPVSGGVATLEPFTVPLVIPEGPREAFIEILQKPHLELVSILELLSPSNKNLPGRVEYLSKRRALLYQKVNLVELDLLLRGMRMPTAKPLPAGDYFYLIARSEQRPDAQVFSWSLRDPLPTLPVPLRDPDPDIIVDLAAVLRTTYERARFGRKINYRETPSTLPEEHREWVKGIVDAHSRAR